MFPEANPNDPIDKNAKDTTTIKTGLGDLNKAFDKIYKENAAKKKATKEEFNFSTIRNKLGEAVHRIGLTVTDPDHPMVSKRKETIQKTVRVTSDSKDNAIKSAIAHHKRKGYKVHDHHYIGTVNEAKDAREYDYEGDIAMSDLRSILNNAKTVHDMLEPKTNIPEWCQSKITLAEDYISTVANYMRGEMSEEVQIDEAKPGLYANIHAKRKRIKGGSGERMRKPGAKGAPTAQAFKDSAKTAKK